MQRTAHDLLAGLVDRGGARVVERAQAMVGAGRGPLDVRESFDDPREVVQRHPRDVEVLLRAQSLDPVVGVGRHIAIAEQIMLAASGARHRAGVGHRGVLQVGRRSTALPTTARVTGGGGPHGPYHGSVLERRPPTSLAAAFQRQAVLTLALIALGGILVVGVISSAALAGLLLALLLGVLAVLRAVLPIRAVGALAVRSRGLDVAVLLLLAISLGLLSAAPNL